MAEEHAGTVDNELLTKLEQALFEIRRVIAGQEEMLERVSYWHTHPRSPGKHEQRPRSLGTQLER